MSSSPIAQHKPATTNTMTTSASTTNSPEEHCSKGEI